MINERIMTEGDLIDYVRSIEMLASIRMANARNPRGASAMRSAANAALRNLEMLNNRYGEE